MRLQDGHIEIYSVDRVTASRNAERQDYVPFSSFRHKGGMLRDEAPERYFHTRLKRAANGLHDTWLILGGEGFDSDRLRTRESLSLRLTGTHGQLPRKALQSTVLDTLVQSPQAGLRVRNLCAPSLPCYPPNRDRFHWRVLSHLGSNFLPMLDNAEVLRGTLGLVRLDGQRTQPSSSGGDRRGPSSLGPTFRERLFATRRGYRDHPRCQRLFRGGRHQSVRRDAQSLLRLVCRHSCVHPAHADPATYWKVPAMERESQSAYSRLKASGLLDALQGQVAEANLQRFCQLLEQALPDHPPLGSTAHPADDAVRFRPDPGMGFPAGELKSIEIDETHPERAATVRTRLLGLYGVDSPMPTVYLDDIAQRREGHEALEAFLDMFNHRIFTQFYRIWRKYSYPATFEAGAPMPPRNACWA